MSGLLLMAAWTTSAVGGIYTLTVALRALRADLYFLSLPLAAWTAACLLAQVVSFCSFLIVAPGPTGDFTVSLTVLTLLAFWFLPSAVVVATLLDLWLDERAKSGDAKAGRNSGKPWFVPAFGAAVFSLAVCCGLPRIGEPVRDGTAMGVQVDESTTNYCAKPSALEELKKQMWGTCVIAEVSPAECTLRCNGGRAYSTAGLKTRVLIDGVPADLASLSSGMEMQYWAVLDTQILLGIRAYTDVRGRPPEAFRSN